MNPSDQWLRQARSLWRWTGRERPAFAAPTAPGQESVWDYPRPPRIAHDPREVVISLGNDELARSRRALRVLETASPPTFYLPVEDIRMALLRPSAGASLCEWKGEAQYWQVGTGAAAVERRAWSYPAPFPGCEALLGHIGFYPSPFECTVDGERVKPQPGGFYAGWITADVVGPFKGDPGSSGW